MIAPRLTKPYREELQVLGVTAQQEEPGVWQLQGGLVLHPTWVLETDELVGLEHPLLSLVSKEFLANRVAIYNMLHQGGYTDLVVYLAQQITQFNLRGEEFAMKHLGAEDEMKQALRDLMASWPLEQRLAGVSLEKRLEGLSPRERLKGLSPEELLEGLTPEDRQRLRQLLQQQPSEDDSSAGK